MPPFKFDTPEVLNQCNDEALDKRQALCKKWLYVLMPMPMILGASTFMLGVTFSKMFPSLDINVVLGVTAVMAVVVCLLALRWSTKVELEVKRLTVLDPMIGDLCERALYMVKASPEAKVWRDKAMLKSRKLRRFDFDEIERRYNEDTLDLKKSRNAAAYHALTTKQSF